MISETIGSVQNQTFKDWECIVVDDGSTDNTKEVVSEISNQDQRVRYVYQKNAERSAARNNGIRHAVGKYICFLDSDDQYCSNYLQELNFYLTSLDQPVSITVCGYYLWDGDTSKEAITPPPTKPFENWFLDHPVTPTRVCIHNSILNEFRFREDIVIVEDTVLWISIITAFPLNFLPNPLVKYHLHEDNSVNRKTTAWLKREAGLTLFFKSRYAMGISKSKKKEMLTTSRWRVAEHYALNQRYAKSIVTAIESILISLFNKHTKAKLYLIWQNIGCLLGLRSSISI